MPIHSSSPISVHPCSSLVQSPIPIPLPPADWGQICDCLHLRMDTYEETAAYHDGEPVYGPIAEVRDADEARTMTDTYRKLIDTIERATSLGN